MFCTYTSVYGVPLPKLCLIFAPCACIRDIILFIVPYYSMCWPVSNCAENELIRSIVHTCSSRFHSVNLLCKANSKAYARLGMCVSVWKVDKTKNIYFVAIRHIMSAVICVRGAIALCSTLMNWYTAYAQKYSYSFLKKIQSHDKLLRLSCKTCKT